MIMKILLITLRNISNTYNKARDRCVDFLLIKVLHDIDGF